MNEVVTHGIQDRNMGAIQSLKRNEAVFPRENM